MRVAFDTIDHNILLQKNTIYIYGLGKIFDSISDKTPLLQVISFQHNNTIAEI